MKIIHSKGMNTFLLSEDKEPCSVCKKETNQIEIYFESRICSDKCCFELLKAYTKQVDLNNMLEI